MTKANANRREWLQYASSGLLWPLGAQAAPSVVRAGILGTRHSHTTGKLKAMQDSTDYEVAGICENDPAAKAQAQKDPRFKGLRWMSEDELLGDPSIHLIVVECNVWEALPWGSKVIGAGKHLHLEKPPGNKWAPFKELVEEARRKKLLLQTGYVWRWHEGVNAALDAARNGWLGEVYMVRGTMNSDRDAGAAGGRGQISGRRFVRVGRPRDRPDRGTVGPAHGRSRAGFVTTRVSPTSLPTTISRCWSTTRRSR